MDRKRDITHLQSPVQRRDRTYSRHRLQLPRITGGGPSFWLFCRQYGHFSRNAVGNDCKLFGCAFRMQMQMGFQLTIMDQGTNFTTHER